MLHSTASSKQADSDSPEGDAVIRHRSPLPRFAAACVAAVALAGGLLATPALAATPTSGPVPATTQATPIVKSAPAGADTGQNTDRPDVRSEPLPAAQRGASVHRAQTAPTAPPSPAALATTGRAATTTGAAAVTSCTTADFAGRTGSALVAYIKTVDWYACINPLFHLTGSDAHAVFKESQMLAVANGLASTAAHYTGDDSGGIRELLSFLRAGYKVQEQHPSDVGPSDVAEYDAALAGPVKSGLTTLFNSSHANDVSAGNGDVLNDAFVVIDSADVQGDYLNVYKRYLDAYNSSWDAFPAMDDALNEIYMGPLWRGPSFPSFVSAITADSSLVDTLNTFALNHRNLLGGVNDVLDSNAGDNLGLLAQIPALKASERVNQNGRSGGERDASVTLGGAIGPRSEAPDHSSPALP